MASWPVSNHAQPAAPIGKARTPYSRPRCRRGTSGRVAARSARLGCRPSRGGPEPSRDLAIRQPFPDEQDDLTLGQRERQSVLGLPWRHGMHVVLPIHGSRSRHYAGTTPKRWRAGERLSGTSSPTETHRAPARALTVGWSGRAPLHGHCARDTVAKCRSGLLIPREHGRPDVVGRTIGMAEPNGGAGSYSMPARSPGPRSRRAISAATLRPKSIPT